MTFRLLSLYLLSATTAAFGSETSPLVRLHPIAADSLLESTTTQNAYLRLGRADGVARSSYIFGGVIEAAVSAESNGTTALGMIYPIGESMRLSAEIGTTTFAGKVTSNAEEVIPSQEFETTETKLIAGFGYHHSQWAATVKALYFTDQAESESALESTEDEISYAAFTADVYVPLSSGKWGIKYESSNSLETQEIIVKRPITWTLYTFIPTQTNNLWGLALIYQVENAIDASRKNGLSPMVSYQSQILQSVELVGYFSYTPETYREAESAGVNSLASVTIGVAADWQFTQALKLSPRIQYIRGKTLEADNILSVDTHRLSMVETTAQLAYYF